MPNKPKGRHPHKALSDRFIRGNLQPGKHADGNGLYLIVDKSGNRRWMLRTTNKARNKQCDFGLGWAVNGATVGIAYGAIRDREQQLIDYHDCTPPNIRANDFQGVRVNNSLGYVHHNLSNTFWIERYIYTGKIVAPGFPGTNGQCAPE